MKISFGFTSIFLKKVKRRETLYKCNFFYFNVRLHLKESNGENLVNFVKDLSRTCTRSCQTFSKDFNQENMKCEIASSSAHIHWNCRVETLSFSRLVQNCKSLGHMNYVTLGYIVDYYIHKIVIYMPTHGSIVEKNVHIGSD